MTLVFVKTKFLLKLKHYFPFMWSYTFIFSLFLSLKACIKLFSHSSKYNSLILFLNILISSTVWWISHWTWNSEGLFSFSLLCKWYVVWIQTNSFTSFSFCFHILLFTCLSILGHKLFRSWKVTFDMLVKFLPQLIHGLCWNSLDVSFYINNNT